MEHAVAFAETGHLAISTLHANNANQALDRIINFFPDERKAQLLHDLGNNIRAIVSQRLIPTVDGKRCAAIEILLGSHTIKQMIMKDQLSDIKEAMLKSENQGMKTFDSALYDLARSGKITEEEALKNADSMNNLRLRFKLSKPLTEESQSENPAGTATKSQAAAPTASAAAASSAATSNRAISPAEEKRNLTRLTAEKARAKIEHLKRMHDAETKTGNDTSQSASLSAGNGGPAANDQVRSQPRNQAPTGTPPGGIELSLVVDEEEDTAESDEPGNEKKKDSGLFGIGTRK
jgi:hypothetical protein